MTERSLMTDQQKVSRPWGVHALHDIYHPDVGAQMPDGRYVAAVSLPYTDNRLVAAWWVLTGRAYAILWPKAGELEDIFRRRPCNLRRNAGPFRQAGTEGASANK